MRYIYNSETLSYEAVGEPRWLRCVRHGLMAACAFGLVYFFFWMYTSVFGWDLPKTAILKKRNAAYKAKVELVNRQLDFYQQTLEGLEDRNDNVYRSIYGLNAIPDEVKAAGYGGTNRYEYLDRLGAGNDLKKLSRRLDVLMKRSYVQSMSLDEVEVVSRQAGDMISCVPGVPPLCPDGRVRLSSSFGGRRDPIYGCYESHGGQDFATSKGTPVYSTGDGVVELARFQFRGYGNEVIVNHGYGYKTHYAHLNTIEVVEGMKVRRGERIGSVGNTGKSTGPHLHYEVIYKDKKVNPMNYMDFTMDVSEFNAMIENSSAENPRNHRTSTAEILRRRRQSDER